MFTTQILTIEIVKQTCIKCGCTFGIEKSHNEQFLQTHKSFCCPNGHWQHYVSKTDAEIIQEELDRTKGYLKNAHDYLDAERNKNKALKDSLKTTKGHITRIKNRVGNGVCPCCNRSFKNLRDHMTLQHPEYKKEA